MPLLYCSFSAISFNTRHRSYPLFCSSNLARCSEGVEVPTGIWQGLGGMVYGAVSWRTESIAWPRYQAEWQGDRNQRDS